MRSSYLTLALVLTALASTSGSQEWDVPDEERSRANPIEVTPSAIEEGKAHFQKQCVMCHGEALAGDGPGVSMFNVKPPDLSTPEARARLTDGEIFYKLSVGKSPMPAMKAKLSETERWKIVLYFRTLQSN